MARRKMRLTAFARFFIVMLFLAPLAYMGASYYNGEDGLQNLKNLLGIGKKEQTEQRQQSDEQYDNNKKNTISYEELVKENRVLKDSVRSKDQQIYKLKQRIIDLQMNR
jgi:hypothetical protein